MYSAIVWGLSFDSTDASVALSFADRMVERFGFGCRASPCQEASGAFACSAALLVARLSSDLFGELGMMVIGIIIAKAALCAAS
jgi:hypothetical protein